MDDVDAMDTSTANDVIISVESTNEWQVHDILYDGTERYLKPLTFQDNVAKLAHKVDWRKLIGSDISQVNPEEAEEDEESEDETAKAKRSEQESVGPWESVAKNLHNALTEMNVLLDVVQIGQQRKYMFLDPVESAGNDAMIDVNKNQLASLFTFKKKIMSQGQKIFENINDRLVRSRQQSASQVREPDFQSELIELRQAWRLKKVGNTILGDLSYKNYGTKFRSNSTFEVKKSDTSSNIGGVRTAIEITLPKDLEQNVCLNVSIEKICERSINSPPVDVFFRGENFGFRAGMKNWQQRLIVAQRTLLCRDLFLQLCKEAVHMTGVSCSVRGDFISINVCVGYLLKISLVPYSSESSREENYATNDDSSVFALQHNLFQLFCADLDAVTTSVVARPVSAPLTFQNRRLRVAGPEALSARVLRTDCDTDKLLSMKIIEQARHYILFNSLRDSLAFFVDECRDPSVYVHWLSESTGTWSLARVSMVTPFYECFNKTSIVLELGINSVVLATREGEEVKFSSDVDDVIKYLLILAKQHLITALLNMARQINWICLSCCLTVVDENGILCPTLLLVNSSSTKSICVKCPLNEPDPKVYIQTSFKSREEFASDLLSDDLWSYIRGTFRLVDYSNLIGRCFLQKMELLISALS